MYYINFAFTTIGHVVHYRLMIYYYHYCHCFVTKIKKMTEIHNTFNRYLQSIIFSKTLLQSNIIYKLLNVFDYIKLVFIFCLFLEHLSLFLFIKLSFVSFSHILLILSTLFSVCVFYYYIIQREIHGKRF